MVRHINATVALVSSMLVSLLACHSRGPISQESSRDDGLTIAVSVADKHTGNQIGDYEWALRSVSSNGERGEVPGPLVACGTENGRGGILRIDLPSEGRYVVQVEAEGYALSTSKVIEVSNLGGVNVTIGLSYGGVISGSVSVGSIPVANAEIETVENNYVDPEVVIYKWVKLAPLSHKKITTNKSGHFVIRNLVPGVYGLRISSNGSWGLSVNDVVVEESITTDVGKLELARRSLK